MTTDPFGLPPSAEDWTALLATLGGAEDGSCRADVVRDMAVAAATGRWSFAETHREPSRMIPGDILAMRAEVALGLIGDAPDGHDVPWEDGEPAAAAVLRAVPYWLPAGAEAAVLDSEPPPDQPRLGAPSAVWLAEPLSVPPVAFPPHLATIADLGSDPDGRHRRRFTAPMERSIRTLRAVCDAPGGSRVRGVLLTADSDGTLGDLIGWVMEIPAADDDLWRSRQILFARRSLTAWRSVIDMLAAVVGWGDWTDPVGRVPDEPDRAWLRRLRYGATRRAEQSGEVAGVRVLDARRRTRPAERSNALGTHASPVTHPRRGHFRRQVHGPRHDPWHETIWVPPTMVNPGFEGTGRVTVWRLPDPP